MIFIESKKPPYIIGADHIKIPYYKPPLYWKNKTIRFNHIKHIIYSSDENKRPYRVKIVDYNGDEKSLRGKYDRKEFLNVLRDHMGKSEFMNKLYREK